LNEKSELEITRNMCDHIRDTDDLTTLNDLRVRLACHGYQANKLDDIDTFLNSAQTKSDAEFIVELVTDIGIELNEEIDAEDEEDDDEEEE